MKRNHVFKREDYRISESRGLIGEDLAADGRYELEMPTDLDAFAVMHRDDYAAAVIYTTGCGDELNTQNLNRRHSYERLHSLILSCLEHETCWML